MLLAFLLTAGCNPAAEEEEPAEEPVEEEYASPGVEKAKLECALMKAEDDVESQEDADRLLAPMSPEYPLPELLKDAGYSCTNQEALDFLEERKLEQEAAAEKHRQAAFEQQKSKG